MRQWHRIGGVFSSLFLLVLAITGIFLMHAKPSSLEPDPSWSRLPYPGPIHSVLRDPATRGDITVVLKEDWWFRSNDGGKVWQSFRLPERETGFYDVMKALHTGWMGRPVLPFLNDAAAVILIMLIVTGFWLYFQPAKIKKSRRKK